MPTTPAYASTALPQDNSIQEIQKANLDLLSKINAQATILAALQATVAAIHIPSTGGLAPLPTTSAGKGQWLGVNPGLAAAFVLPAGGTWSYYYQNFSAAGSWNGQAFANIAAGGTTVEGGTAGEYHQGFEWEIQDTSDMNFSKPIELLPDLDPFGQPMYVVTKLNGYPYGVISTDPLWEEVQLWIAAGNTPQTYVPPVAVPPIALQQAYATVTALQAKYMTSQIVGPTALNQLTPTDITNYKAAQAVIAGD